MSTTKNLSITKVIIPCRISFANIWEPKAINGGDEKYSVSCVIPKSDKKTIARIQKAVEAAKEDGKTRKWNGKIPPNLKLPLRDGDIDRPDDETYEDCVFLNATSKDAPPGGRPPGAADHRPDAGVFRLLLQRVGQLLSVQCER